MLTSIAAALAPLAQLVLWLPQFFRPFFPPVPASTTAHFLDSKSHIWLESARSCHHVFEVVLLGPKNSCFLPQEPISSTLRATPVPSSRLQSLHPTRVRSQPCLAISSYI